MPTPITFGAVSARGFGFGSASAERYWGAIGASGTWQWVGEDTDGKGNLIFIGQSGSVAVTASIGSDGSITWSRQLTDPGYGITVNAIAVDGSGNSYVGLSGGRTGNAIAKYNSSGVLQWQKSYILGGVPASLCCDSSGNVYVALFRAGASSYGQLLKIDSTGSVQWYATWTLPTPTGQVVISDGTSVYLSNQGQINCCCVIIYYGQVMKVSSSGALTWSKQSSPTYDGLPSTIGLTGSYVVCRSAGNVQKYYIFDASAGTATRYDLSASTNVAGFSSAKHMGSDASGSLYVSGVDSTSNRLAMSKLTFASGVPTLTFTTVVAYSGVTAPSSTGIVTTPAKAVITGYTSSTLPMAAALHLNGSGAGTFGSFTVSSLGSLPTFSSQTSPFTASVSGFALQTNPTASSSSLTESAYTHPTYNVTPFA